MSAPIDLDVILARAEAAMVDMLAVVDRLRTDNAAAWEAGHKHPWRRGPNGCTCYARSASECACGRYGTGELLSLADNPYGEPGPSAPEKILKTSSGDRDRMLATNKAAYEAIWRRDHEAWDRT